VPAAEGRLGDGGGLGPHPQEPVKLSEGTQAVVGDTDCVQAVTHGREEQGAHPARTVDSPTDPLVALTTQAQRQLAIGNVHGRSPVGLRGGSRSGVPTWHPAPIWEAQRLTQEPSRVTV
jgi:hypothetical protein